MQSFEQFAEYILKNSDHNQVNEYKHVHIILDYPLLPWSEFYQYLMTLTWYTGIGWSYGPTKKHNVIFAKTLDEAMSKTDQYDHALVSYVGTFYRFPVTETDKHIYHYLDKFKQSDSPCRGHILWHPDKQYGKLHYQSMFLNIDHWRKIGRPSFGKWTGEVMLPELSPTHVHDDYTPHWLKPSNTFGVVEKAEMAEYISAVLKDGKEITNFHTMERNSKFFTYPQRPEISPQLVVEQTKSSDILYRYNNQKLSSLIRDVPNKKYDVIYAPASGYVAEFLWSRYGHANTKLFILDNHKPSISWKDGLFNTYGRKLSSVKDIDRITYMVSNVSGCGIDNVVYKPEILEENEQVFSQQDWVDTINKITNVDIRVFDFINDPLPESEGSKLVYTSNIFCYIFHYHNYTLEELNSSFNKLLQIPNVTLVGQNPFRRQTIYENSSS